MFKETSSSKIAAGRSSYENTGFRLEEEFIGTVDKYTYKELAYQYLNPQPTPEANWTEKQRENWAFEQMKIKDLARTMFEDYLSMKKDKIDYTKAMELVEKSQTGNPEKPTKFFSHALYNHIKERFNEDYVLKFYTAAGGTHFDVKYYVDCFFKLYIREEDNSLTEMAMATIDLTQRDNKYGPGDSSADVLMNISSADKDRLDPSPKNNNFDKNFFEEEINKFGEYVVQALKRDNQRRAAA